MPPKRRPAPAKGAAAAGEPPNKRTRPKRGVAAANGFAPESPAPDATNLATLTIMFDSLSTRMDEMNADTTAELANFDENLQANTRHLDDLFAILQQIQQALPQKSLSTTQDIDSGFY